MNQEDVKKTMEQICDFPIPATVSWKETAEKSLKGASYERKLLTQTYEGITIHPLYRKEDIAGLPFINVMPGQFPYTRGTSTSLPVKTPWEISQEIRESTPERFHCALKHDIQRGQNSLVIMLDQNVKLGIDPFDGKEAAGKEGLSICNAEDVKTALQSIEAADVPFHVETGEHPLPVFSLFLAALDGSVKELKGSIAADPFGAWVIKGELTYELEKIFNGMAEIVRWCQEQECPVKTILVSTSPYHNGGASAVEELAYALATAVTYIEELKERKIPPEEAAKRIRFQFSIGSDYFLEIAKLRAARSLWANVMAAYTEDEKARKMNIHARTSSWTKTLYDPYVNILRASSEAFSAAIGQADSIQVSPFDESFQKPTSFSRRIARNTQVILQEEAHIGKTADAAGGSYYIETMTNELAEKAWKLFQEIERKGGMTKAIENGAVQKRVEDISSRKEIDINHRKKVFVGTNQYPDIEENPVSVIPEDDSQEIEEFVQKTTSKKRTEDIEERETRASIVYEGIERAKKGWTLGQIATWCGKQVPGNEITSIEQKRGAERFETLRKNALAFEEKSGEPLKTFLVNLGELRDYKPRADFVTGFFQTGGFKVISENGSLHAQEAVEKAMKAKAPFVVLCGKEEDYSTMAPEIIEGIKKTDPTVTVMIAGKTPDSLHTILMEKGLDGTVSLGSNAYELLKTLQQKKGAEAYEQA